MKKWLICFVLAGWMGTAQAKESRSFDAPHFYIEGHAQIDVVPDRASLRATIHVEANTVDTAKSQADQVIKRALQLARRFKVKDSLMNASQLRIVPQYRYNADDRRQLTGFKVSRDLTLVLSDLKQYPALLQGLVDAGVNEFSETAFYVADQDRYMKQLRHKAILDAKQQARSLAKAFDVKLKGLHSATFVPHQGIQRPMPTLLESRSFRSSAEAYQSGHVTLTTTVQTVYLIE